MRERVDAECGSLPFVLLVNKNDLADQWADGPSPRSTAFAATGWWVRATSAKTGEGVEDAFSHLALRVAS